MKCIKCFTDISETEEICHFCGTRQHKLKMFTEQIKLEVTEKRTTTYGLLSLASSIIALLFLPVIFGPLGIFFGIISCKSDDNIVGRIGLVLGVINVLIVGIRLLAL